MVIKNLTDGVVCLDGNYTILPFDALVLPDSMYEDLKSVLLSFVSLGAIDLTISGNFVNPFFDQELKSIVLEG